MWYTESKSTTDGVYKNMKNQNKYIVCPDSFKGSVSAQGAAAAIKRGILRYDATATVIECPIADGGEGTLDALVGEEARVELTVCGTDRTPTNAQYGYIGDAAIIEMATAAGLCLVPEERRNPEAATTYGVGELVLDALERGFRKIMITVGGSGTNDGGSGMLEALGAEFFDADGNILSMCGGALAKVDRIDISKLDKRLFETEFTFACDVTNPLLGERGATYVYGAQKGADPDMQARLESGMTNYADKLRDASGKDIRDVAGCGAGGGMAAPIVALCGAKIRSGIESVLNTVGFDEKLDGAKLVITGEGKIDRQSAYGKAISGVTERAAAKGIPVYALVGIKGEGADELLSIGITKISAIKDIAPSVDYSINHADILLEQLIFDELTKEQI